MLSMLRMGMLVLAVLSLEGCALIRGVLAPSTSSSQTTNTTTTNDLLSRVMTDQSVLSMARDGSGNTYIAGDFTRFKPYLVPNAVMINPLTGIADETFNVKEGFNGRVRTSALLSDGSIIVGGDFSQYQNIARGSIAKLDSKGNLSTTFATGVAFGGSSVVTITVDEAAGKIYVGHSSHTFDTTSVGPLIRLNLADGSLDTSFDPMTISTAMASVNAVIKNGNTLYAAGYFDTCLGVNVSNLCKIDLSASPISAAANFPATTLGQAAGDGFDSSINNMVLIGGNLYVNGDFTSYINNGVAVTNTGASTIHNLAKFNASTGVIDTSFPVDTTLYNDSFSTMQTDGTYLYAGTTLNFYKFDTTGALDPAVHTGGIPLTADQPIDAILIDGSEILIAGIFSTFNGSAIEKMGRFDTATLNPVATFNVSGNETVAGGSARVYNILKTSATTAFMGGDFNFYSGAKANAIAKFDSNQVIDTTFNPPTGPNGFDDVNGSTASKLILDGSSLYVVGYFIQYRGTTANNIVKLNLSGTLDSTFATNSGSGFSGAVNTIEISGSDLYVASQGSEYNGSNSLATPPQTLFKISTTGVLDPNFLPDTTHLLLSAPSKLIVAGGSLFAMINYNCFSACTYSSMHGVGKMDLATGATDPNFNADDGNGNLTVQPFDGSVFSMAYSNGKIYVGGAFTDFFTRLNPNTGAVDNTYLPAVDNVVETIFSSNSKMYVGGGFTTFSGTSISNMVSLDADGALINGFNFGESCAVNEIGSAGGSNLFAWGLGSSHYLTCTSTKKDLVINESTGAIQN